jgi:hypothetical protein
MKKNKKKEAPLEEQKKTLEDNIKFEQDMIDNNKHYDNDKTNMSYGPDHYRKAIEYDKEELNRINTIERFRKAADEALSGKSNNLIKKEKKKK